MNPAVINGGVILLITGIVHFGIARKGNLFIIPTIIGGYLISKGDVTFSSKVAIAVVISIVGILLGSLLHRLIKKNEAKQ